jgi:hypothetical protein
MVRLKIVTDTGDHLSRCEQASRLDNRTLAVDPVRLQGIQPGAFHGQAARQEPDSSVLLGLLIVGSYLDAHLECTISRGMRRTRSGVI